MRKREATCGVYDPVDVMACKEWCQDLGKGARHKANSLPTQGSSVKWEVVGVFGECSLNASNA